MVAVVVLRIPSVERVLAVAVVVLMMDGLTPPILEQQRSSPSEQVAPDQQ